MKRIFILVCAVVSVLTDSSCDIADGMKTMRECCVTPNHSNFMLERLCQQIVSVKSKVEQHERAIECYLNMTNLIKNETINKAAVIKIYENNAMFDPEWSQQIREGVDKCSFDSSGTLEHNLLKFYNCVDDFLGENCVNVLQIPECESVQEFYENCKHIQPNCTSWPRSLANPEVCCKIPKVLSNNLYSKCQMECQRKELFIQRQTECTHNCTFLESGLMVEGKFNFAVVKKMLSENANNTELWEKSIEVAVETCEKTVKDFDKSSVQEQIILAALMRCLADNLSNNCVEFRDEVYCRKIRHFMTKCPNTKPRHGKNYHLTVQHTVY